MVSIRLTLLFRRGCDQPPWRPRLMRQITVRLVTVRLAGCVSSVLSRSPRPACKPDCVPAFQPAAAGHLYSSRSPAGASSIASRLVGFRPVAIRHDEQAYQEPRPPHLGDVPSAAARQDGAIGSARKGLAALAPWPLRLWQRMWARLADERRAGVTARAGDGPDGRAEDRASERQRSAARWPGRRSRRRRRRSRRNGASAGCRGCAPSRQSPSRQSSPPASPSVH